MLTTVSAGSQPFHKHTTYSTTFSLSLGMARLAAYLAKANILLRRRNTRTGKVPSIAQQPSRLSSSSSSSSSSSRSSSARGLNMGCNNSKYACRKLHSTTSRKRANLTLDVSSYDKRHELQLRRRDDSYGLDNGKLDCDNRTPLPRTPAARTPAMTPHNDDGGVAEEPAAQNRACTGHTENRNNPSPKGPSRARHTVSFKDSAAYGGSTAELSAESAAGSWDESDSDDGAGDRAREGELENNHRERKHMEDPGSAIDTPTAVDTTPDIDPTTAAAAPQGLQHPPPGAGHAELQAFLHGHRPRPLPDAMKDPSRAVFPDGLTYEGQLRSFDGMPHGWGSVLLPGGATYEGSWFSGRVHGRGALRLPNGNSYWGSWAYGRKHGRGTFLWADGSRHDGHYLAGKKRGVGTLLYATGATFEGEFEDDLRHGVGRLELANGSSYDGQWVKDVPHGYGVFVGAGRWGERFEGSWERGVRCGGGRLVQGGDEETDGSAGAGGTGGVAWYSGNFEEGLPHGDGTMGYGRMTYCGHVERGEWTGGGGRLDLGDGTGSFEGAWRDGLPRGSGRWRCEQTGVEEDGTFKEGYSKLIWPS